MGNSTIHGDFFMQLNVQQRAVLRSLLAYPLIWRIAYRLIVANCDHDISDTASCLLCAALSRKKKYRHQLAMSNRRELYCKKCGLLLRTWNHRPRCAGRPKQTAIQSAAPAVAFIPINWE